MKRPYQSLGRMYAVPLVIWVVSLAGLVFALTGDGVRDALSWAALAVPVGAVAWAMKFRRS